MTDADSIVENLINSEGIHAFVFVCEAADKYLPMIESVGVLLQNGNTVPVTQIDRGVEEKVMETRKSLKREDRIIWALRFFKKALAEQLLWMVANEPNFFKKRYASPPAPEQPGLVRQLSKLGDVDITPFQEYDPEDPETTDSPYSGFSVIDAINSRLDRFFKVAATYGANEPDNIINTLQFSRQTFGEIVSTMRRGEIDLLRRKAASLHIWPSTRGDGDMQDEEGPIQTIVKFPNGWRWFDLKRNCSPVRDDRAAPSYLAKTGHCANVAAKGKVTLLELAEPLGGDRWKHHALFVLHKNGRLGEMKGRKNQKPSPRLHKYIVELLLQDRRINGLGVSLVSHAPHNDFSLADLPKAYIDLLREKRPRLFKDRNVRREEEDEDEEEDVAGIDWQELG